MGWCQVGSSTQPCDPEDCAELGGGYKEKGGKECFLLNVLADEQALLMTSTWIYPAMIQFRDDILRTAPLGRKMLAHFDRFYDEGLDIARQDGQLVTDIIWLATYSAPFVQASLGTEFSAGIYGHTPTTFLAERVRPSVVGAIRTVIDRFRRHASDDFLAALEEFDRELDRFVGLTPREALVELRRERRREET